MLKGLLITNMLVKLMNRLSSKRRDFSSSIGSPFDQIDRLGFKVITSKSIRILRMKLPRTLRTMIRKIMIIEYEPKNFK